MDNPAILMMILSVMVTFAIIALLLIVLILKKKGSDNSALQTIIGLLVSRGIELYITPVNILRGEKLYCIDYYMQLRKYKEDKVIAVKFRIETADFRNAIQEEKYIIQKIKWEMDKLNEKEKQTTAQKQD